MQRRKTLPLTLLRILCTLVIAVLPLLLPAGMGSAEAKDRRLHPALEEVVRRHPDALVDVIVQKTKRTTGPDDEARKAGGKLTRALPLVNAFAARLPAKAVERLAEADGVRYVSLDAPLRVAAVDTSALVNTYDAAINAPAVWNGAGGFTGRGVSVAVIDTGVTPHPDLGSRIVANVNLINSTSPATDDNGHGTHVAGIIAGNGAVSGGRYLGIAPEAQIVNIKVADAQGMAYTSAVIDALQWAVAYKATYNIRVVNLSLIGSVAESYLTSPLCAAVEAAWFQGLVVVVAAGNGGADTALYPPANDPFAITVGATYDGDGTSDDLMPTWSAYGVTQDGFLKPDVVAPGRRIVSLNAGSLTTIALSHPERIVERNYLLLSGTSMAAPMVAGLAALAFQAHPTWTPDQFKWVVLQTARPFALPGTGSGYADAQAVVGFSASPGLANQGLMPNSSIDPATGLIAGTSATWSSATWSSATWSSATWSSATWTSATRSSSSGTGSTSTTLNFSPAYDPYALD